MITSDELKKAAGKNSGDLLFARLSLMLLQP